MFGEESNIFRIRDSVKEHNFSLDLFIHSLNVANVSRKMGEELMLSTEQKKELYTCALLHDIGKSRIVPNIFYKNDKLTSVEIDIIKKHSGYSEEIFHGIMNLNNSREEMAKNIRFHHENWDGSGYPDRKKGYGIPFISRIIRTTDIFDAITQPRVHRPYIIKTP